MKIESAKQYIELGKPEKVWVYKIAEQQDRDDYTKVSKKVPEFLKVDVQVPRRWDYTTNEYHAETDPEKYDYKVTLKGNGYPVLLWTQWNYESRWLRVYGNRKEAWDAYQKELKEIEEKCKNTNKLAKLRKQKEKLERERCTVTYAQIAEKFGIPVDKLIITGGRW